MTVRPLILFLLVLPGLLLAGSISHAADRPNIILLMGDDHGWDEAGYNGHPHLHTPVLDEMAAAGLKLNRFYSAHPSCSPTRASVMTGRHPNRCGTFAPNWSTRPEEITIAQLLSQAGYRCGHFGKWHLGPVKADSPISPGAMGFDEWLAHDNFFELNPQFSRNGGPPEQFEGESSEILIEEAIRFIEQSTGSGKPFFTVVWYGSPHEPYSGLEKDLALYDDLPEEYADTMVRLTSNETGRPTQRPLRDVLRERYAEITAMDRSIGRLRDWLSEQGLRENTLVWYCGDNGTPGDGIVTSPFRGKKGNMYEGGLRVPGLIEWPAKITEPMTSDVHTVTSDMLPTLCDIVGVDVPQRPLDGIGLLPLIEGKMTERPEPIFFWSYNTRGEARGREPYIAPPLQQGTTPLVKLMGNIATRNFSNYRHPEIAESDYNGTRVMLGNRYKLIVHNNGKIELFDIVADPAEKTDLAEDNPEVAEAMQQQLRDWQHSVLTSLTGADY
ncbi:MAG: sulfatase [Maioricimonas sp. JB045]